MTNKTITENELKDFIIRYPWTLSGDTVFNESYSVLDSEYVFIKSRWDSKYSEHNEIYKEYNKFINYSFISISQWYKSSIVPFKKATEMYFISAFWFYWHLRIDTPAEYISLDDMYVIYDYIVEQLFNVLEKNEEDYNKISSMPWFIWRKFSLYLELPEILEETTWLDWAFKKNNFKQIMNIYKDIIITDWTRYKFEEYKKECIYYSAAQILK